MRVHGDLRLSDDREKQRVLSYLFEDVAELIQRLKRRIRYWGSAPLVKIPASSAPAAIKVAGELGMEFSINRDPSSTYAEFSILLKPSEDVHIMESLVESLAALDLESVEEHVRLLRERGILDLSEFWRRYHKELHEHGNNT